MLKVRVSNSFQTGKRFQVALLMITLDTEKVILDAKIELVTWPKHMLKPCPFGCDS